METQQEWFNVTRLSRDDLRAEGFDPSKVSDTDMEALARKIEDAIMETGVYWDVISDYCQHEELPRLEE